MLYPVCAPAWFLQDGTIDESKLKEFLTVLKKIGDAEKAGTGQEEPDQTIVFVGGGGLSSNTADALMGLFDYLYGNRVLNAGAISSVNDLSYIISANDSLGLSYVPMNGQASNVYIPRNIVGHKRQKRTDRGCTGLHPGLSLERESAHEHRRLSCKPRGL